MQYKTVKEPGEALEPLNRDLINQLVQNHREFRAFLSRRVSNEAVAEELFQQGIVKAMESQSSLNDREKLVPWFYQLLRNLLVDYYRSDAAQARKHQAFLNELENGDQMTSPAPDELTSAICRCLKVILPTLKPAYAELIKRIDLESEPLEMVAKDLGLSLNNLSVRLHRARQAMRQGLVRTCGTCTEHACLDCTCK